MQALLGPRRCGPSGRCAAAEDRAPPGRASPWRPAAAITHSSALMPTLLVVAGVSRSGTAPTAESWAPSAAGRGGAGARSRGLTSPWLLGGRGLGTAASRLTCSGGGEAGLGGSSAHAHCPCGGRARLRSAIRPPDSRFNLSSSVERRRLGTAFSVAADLVFARGGAFLPSLKAGLGFLKVKPAGLGEKTWGKDFIHLIHSLVFHQMEFPTREGLCGGSAGLLNHLRADKPSKSLRNV